IKDRLFLEQTAQYRYSAADVPSLPQNLLRISKSFSAFTRLDANVSRSHSLVAAGGLFPSVSNDATLGTFTPPEATVNLHAHANQSSVTERSLWTDWLFGETTAQMHAYGTDVLPQGSAVMQVQPQTTLGNFFNQQRRDSGVYQAIESLSGARKSPGGLHVFKMGLDVLHSQYDGSSLSRPMLIERSDGTLARRLDFPAAPTAQSVGSTDVALFAQDRFETSTRWYLEFGVRLDRDGVVDRVNVTPRAGAAVLLNASGNAVLRGGFGLFYERTPSVAGTFDEFESAVDTRFARDGVTPAGPPVLFVHATDSALKTPRSRSWDINYDHRLNKMWALHLGGIDRQGSHELIVNPVRTGTAGELLLSSSGRSSYRGAEVGVRFTRGTLVDLNVSYARSVARADLNALTNYFSTILWPVVGVNAYAPASGDVPHRLLARGRLIDVAMAPARRFRLAQWSAVLRRQRDARLRRSAKQLALPDVRAPRGRRRASLQDPQISAVDWRARMERAQFVHPHRRPGESRLSFVRVVLQLRVSPIPDPGAIRTLVERAKSGLATVLDRRVFVCLCVLAASIAAGAPAIADLRVDRLQ
ncbi:MAG: hypothetical protein DMF97_22070, partial [Acidobacteria bacterium]